jgi:hypothetical protein
LIRYPGRTPKVFTRIDRLTCGFFEESSMSKTAVVLVIVVLAVILVSPMRTLYAASLAGVTMPDTVQVGSTKLVLNGVGLRTKFVVKVYVAGLYLEQKSSDAGAILKADAPKRLVMQFVHGASKSQMTNAFEDSFKDNSPDAVKTMKGDIDKFLGAVEPVKDGDQMVFTYFPGTGTTLTINGQDKVTISGAAFAEVLFSVWLGPKPPNADLKKGILGMLG